MKANGLWIVSFDTINFLFRLQSNKITEILRSGLFRTILIFFSMTSLKIKI